MAGDGLHLFSDEEEAIEEKTPEVSGNISENEKQSEVEEHRYLLFSIGDSTFSTKLMEIREVIGMVEYQAVPNTRKYFLGMANIRGEVVGLIDSSAMLGVSSREDQERSAIIIFDTEHGALGMKVDEVHGVREITGDFIDNLPQVDSVVPQKYMSGIAKLDDKLIAVIELKELLSEDDMVLIKKAS